MKTSLKHERDPTANEMELTIHKMGDQGDGIAEKAGRLYYVPYSLPGEVIKVRSGTKNHLDLERIEKPSAERVPAPCVYFGQCGGCELQHWQAQAYVTWKKRLVEGQLSRHSISMPPGTDIEFLAVPPASRRRVTLAARRSVDGVSLGFHRGHSHDIVPLDSCLIVTPAIGRLLPVLSKWLSLFLPVGKEVSIAVIDADNGLDLAIISDWPLSERLRRDFPIEAIPPSWKRVTWQVKKDEPEILFLRDKPYVLFDDIPVEIPPGAFLQPSKEGEIILRRWVQSAIGKARRVADLYAGLGTFALPLAKNAQIYAAELSPLAINALDQAAKKAGLQPRIKVENRHLDRSPLSKEELQDFDAVLFDPPRAGAEAQARNIAQSGLKTAVAVSCDPVSFARDAALLVEGGFRLEKLALLDQFIYSHHIELFGHFVRGRKVS